MCVECQNSPLYPYNGCQCRVVGVIWSLHFPLTCISVGCQNSQLYPYNGCQCRVVGVIWSLHFPLTCISVGCQNSQLYPYNGCQCRVVGVIWSLHFPLTCIRVGCQNSQLYPYNGCQCRGCHLELNFPLTCVSVDVRTHDSVQRLSVSWLPSGAELDCPLMYVGDGCPNSRLYPCKGYQCRGCHNQRDFLLMCVGVGGQNS